MRSAPLRFSLAGVALLDHEIPAVTVQKHTIQNRVVGVEVDVGALRHGLVLVLAQEGYLRF